MQRIFHEYSFTRQKKVLVGPVVYLVPLYLGVYTTFGRSVVPFSFTIHKHECDLSYTRANICGKQILNFQSQVYALEELVCLSNQRTLKKSM